MFAGQAVRQAAVLQGAAGQSPGAILQAFAEGAARGRQQAVGVFCGQHVHQVAAGVVLVEGGLEGYQVGINGCLGGPLQVGVQRGLDHQAVPVVVETVLLLHRFQPLAHPFGEIGAHAGFILFFATEGDGLTSIAVQLFFVDVASPFHQGEHQVPPCQGFVRVTQGRVVVGRFQQAHDQGGLRRGELGGFLAEVEVRSGFDAVGAVAEIHVGEVDLQDLFF